MPSFLGLANLRVPCVLPCPRAAALRAFLTGGAAQVLLHKLQAHERAYAAMKAVPGAEDLQIGIVHHHVEFMPYHPSYHHLKALCWWGTFWWGRDAVLDFFQSGKFEWFVPLRGKSALLLPQPRARHAALACSALYAESLPRLQACFVPVRRRGTATEKPKWLLDLPLPHELPRRGSSRRVRATILLPRRDRSGCRAGSAEAAVTALTPGLQRARAA